LDDHDIGILHLPGESHSANVITVSIEDISHSRRECDMSKGSFVRMCLKYSNCETRFMIRCEAAHEHWEEWSAGQPRSRKQRRHLRACDDSVDEDEDNDPLREAVRQQVDANSPPYGVSATRPKVAGARDGPSKASAACSSKSCQAA
jgi:hypothetical protein